MQPAADGPPLPGSDVVAVPAAPAAPAVEPFAFERFFAENRSSVMALVYVISGSRQAAEDLAQDAFTEAFRRWDRISGYDDPGAWVRRVALNRALSGARRRASERRALTRLAGRPDVVTEQPVTDDQFWSAVRALPPRQAQAVALFYLEDRSVADIARILDRAEATVRVHLHRGRLELARTLGLDHQEDEP